MLIISSTGFQCEISCEIKKKYIITRWWFETFFMFTPKIGEDFPFDEHVFQMGGKKTTNQISIQCIWSIEPHDLGHILW